MTSFANMTQSLGASLPTVSASAQAPGGSGEQEEDSLPFIENYFTNLLGNINSGHNMQSNVASTSTPPKSYNIWPAQSTSTGHSYTKFNGREYNIVSSNKHQSRSKEDVSSLSPETVSVSCYRCERNPTIRCLECNDLLCHECCYKTNSECQLREHTILPIHQISPIGARPNSVPVDKETVYCETHGEPVRYYCEGCILFICQQCTAWIHRDHRYASLRGALDLCKVAMCTIMEHTRMGTKAIKSAIDKSVNVTKAFDKEAAEANMKIRKAMRSFVQAVEDREKCLLDKVEKMRLAKANEINDYTHALRGMLSGLSNVNDNLVRLMDSEGIELFMAKEKAKEQVACYAQVFKSMYLVEDRIIFQPPNYELLEHIKSLGDVQVVGSSTVAPSLSSAALSLPRQSSLYSLQPPSTYAGMSYQMSTSAILRSIPEYTYSHSRTTKYYDTSLAALDSNSPRGIGQAIAGYSSPISLKPTRSPVSGVPVFSFAREGQDEGQVSRPWGLCVDKEGNIIVADRRNNRIQIFNSRGHFKQMFGCKGTGPGQFDLPAGITTDHLGRIIVVDKDNHRVQIFTCRGNFIHKFGSYGKDCGQFQYPWDVAVNTLGNIVVTDTRNHRIQLFTSDGTYMRKFVFETTNPAKMLKGPTTPRGVCFTIYGNIIVSDFENHRLLMVDPTLSKLLCCIGREGTGICELNRPSGIITDDDGRVIVADSKNHRVLVFTSELRVLFAGDLKSPGLDDKDRPSDVALTPDGYLVVLFETLPDTARDITSHSKQYIKVY